MKNKQKIVKLTINKPEKKFVPRSSRIKMVPPNVPALKLFLGYAQASRRLRRTGSWSWRLRWTAPGHRNWLSSGKKYQKTKSWSTGALQLHSMVQGSFPGLMMTFCCSSSGEHMVWLLLCWLCYAAGYAVIVWVALNRHQTFWKRALWTRRAAGS